MRYVPALDGLRAVAIAGVVFRHAFGWPEGGWLGVDLFFVLSGFLITTLLVEEHRREGQVSLRRFYERRARRLLPALFVMLAVVLAVSRDVGWVLAGVVYVMNFAMARDAGWAPAELSHLWSLAAEEQFYLVWPLVLFALLAGRVRRGFMVAAAGAVLASVWAFALYLGQAPWQRIAFGPDTRGATILIGCALALYLLRRPVSARRLEIPAIGVFACFLVFGYEPVMRAGLPLLIFGVACAVLLVRALDGTSPLAAFLSLAPLVFLGRISYALYLWHIPILVWIGAESTFSLVSAAGVVLAVAAATASYYIVERPFRRPARNRSPSYSPATASA